MIRIMKMTKLVGFGYKARHGKNYVADEVHALLPRESRTYSLANALKAWARVQGWMTTKDGPLLQTLGTEVFRKCVDPDIWVKVLQQQIKEESPKVALITDVRFLNEANWIKDAGGILVNVTRVNPDGTDFFAPDRSPTHQSEIELDDYNRWDCKIIAKSGAVHILNEAAVGVAALIKDAIL